MFCLLAALSAVATRGQESFFLRVDASGKTYGPYLYADGAVVGEGQAVFELIDVTPLHYRLKPRDGGDPIGPFSYVNGAPVSIGGATLTLMRPSAAIRGHIEHARLTRTPATVSLVPVTPTLLRAFYQLRAAFQMLLKQHDQRTAPIQFGPVVSGTPGYANSRSGIIERSERDIVKSRERLDRQALSLYRKFVESKARGTVKVLNGEPFAWPDPAAGQYLLLAEGTIRSFDGDTRGLTQPVFWWKIVKIDGNIAADVTLSETDARAWDTVFEQILAVDPALGIAPAN